MEVVGTNVIKGTELNDSINLAGVQLIQIDAIEGGGGIDKISGNSGDNENPWAGW